MLFAAGGLIAVVTLGFTWYRDRMTRATVELTRDENRTSRYTEAVTQLGDQTSIAIRLGGIYALERIALDSLRDRQTILDVVTAFVRHARARSVPDLPAQLSEDVSAAVLVIARITAMPGRKGFPPLRPVRLENVSLPAADFRGAVLRGAVVSDCVLSGARFDGVDLEQSSFVDSTLDHASFEAANLAMSELVSTSASGAKFQRAVLADAAVWGADFTRANFTGADLSGIRGGDSSEHAQMTVTFHSALLWECSLVGARLEGADLANASLRNANLTTADLMGAHLSRVDYDDQTRWPAGFAPPRSRIRI